MGHADYYRSGTYNGICDRCGSKFKFSDLKLEWDGLYVCTANGCWEPRQPQDYVKGVRDDMAVPVSRPDTTIFTDTITANTVISSSLLILTINRLKSYLAIVSSVATVILAKYPVTSSKKVIDSFVLNSTTLG
jgi:hypothetical protein